MVNPVVSVIIVSYNSRSDLEACIPTLFQQDIPLEVIVVDNGSVDGTVDYLRNSYPQIRVITQETNDGYAGGNNVGVAASTGEYVFILNPDTELFPGSLAALLDVVKTHPKTIVTPKIVQQDGTVNTCGNKVHFTGITTCNGLGESPNNFSGVFPVALVSGAAFLLTRDTWNDVGGFSSDYFMYMEDMDFSLRARLLGYEIVCCAESVVLHKWKLGMGPRKFFHLERNRLLTVFKIYERKTLLRVCPSLFLTELATWAYAVMKGPSFVGARFAGYASIWTLRKRWRESRRSIQERRTVRDADLFNQLLPTLPFEVLVSPALSRVLEKTTTPLYKPFYDWGTRA